MLNVMVVFIFVFVDFYLVIAGLRLNMIHVYFLSAKCFVRRLHFFKKFTKL